MPKKINPIIQRKIDAIVKMKKSDLTVAEVQAVLGYMTEFPIVSDRGLIARRKVSAAKIGGQWIIDAESLVSYLENSQSVLQLER